MKNTSFVVEIAGPAGAGKSTLTKALSECDRSIKVGMYPYTRDIRNLPFYFYNSVRLLPTFRSFQRCCQKFTRSQYAVMTILEGWPDLLRKQNKFDPAVWLLDQGPVYMLSDLLRSSSDTFAETAQAWWNRTCLEWGSLLNLVICLDAPDAVLLERVRQREKYHGFKQNTDQQAVNFLNRCRQTQNAILNSLHRSSTGPDIICFNTSQISLIDITQSILVLLRKMENRPI